ncbi:MAG TPA: Arm DNA-binding domain-containing protein, partial [Aestuariivirga sp.]|nr:Arm DNA-binding domain-containing protein [Aestuariivirga sp.]
MAKRVGVALTKRVVDAAEKKDKRYYLWDSELSGFGLRVETSGAKTFIVRYRAEGGGRSAAQRFVTVGRSGPLTPEQARRQAKILLGGVAKGEDPADERRAKRREMRISGLIDLYEEEGCVIQRGKRQGQP